MSDVIAGRVELLDPLARGATGSLWRAIDRRYGAICAAKVMRQREGADVLRFVREQTVGSAQGLGAHPHLLPPYTWVAEDDTIVLVMPLVHGGTLSGALADHGPLTPSLVSHLLRQLLDALAAMHGASWVHRDVKPANLLLDRTGDREPHLLLADFGIALHETDVRLTATGLVHGTPGYMAPEVVEGHTSGGPQDVWAAAACALEALAPLPRGERPAPRDLPSRLGPALAGSDDPAAPGLEQVLSDMFASDPRARPSAARALEALPRPTGDPAHWSLTAGGERFEVFDQVEPLEAGSPGHGAPQIPLDGPGEWDGTSPGLHARITARSSAASPSPSAAGADPRDARDVSTEHFTRSATRVAPVAGSAPFAAQSSPVTSPPSSPPPQNHQPNHQPPRQTGQPEDAQPASSARLGRFSLRLGLLLLATSAVSMIAAVALLIGALRGGQENAGAPDTPVTAVTASGPAMIDRPGAGAAHAGEGLSR